MKRGTNRRSFVKTTAALGVGYWVAGGIEPRPSRAANEQINFASIGVGGKGQSDSDDAGKSGNMVAICDIDENTLNGGAKRFPNAKKYVDFRKMLEECEKEIDAVTVSTPDHCHAVASAMAMRMGKHCFTQKPMTKTIEEARVLGNLAREKKLATQMGNQGTAGGTLREAAAVLKSGAMGTINEVHVWTNRPVWPQGKGLEVKAEEVPANVHWAEWIGPAKNRPFSKEIHPFKWRGYWDFGTGALGDMACHTLNMPFMGLNLRDPVTVQATTDGHDGVVFPKWSVITYQYPELDGRAAVKMMWYDGGKRPERSLFPAGEDPSASGVLVIGTKGKMYAPGDYCENGYKAFGFDRPKVEYKPSPEGGHFAEWVRAIRGEGEATSNFPNYAGPLTETVLLGNLAVWCCKEGGEGKKVEWDAKGMTAKNAPEAAHLVKAEYHNGYKL